MESLWNICRERTTHGRGVWAQGNGARGRLTKNVQKCHIKTNSKLRKIESIEVKIVYKKGKGRRKA